MRVVVTGSRSFIGGELLRLCRERRIEVTGLDSRPGGGPEHIEVDIRSPDVERRIGEAPDAVIHLAAISRDQDCRAAPEQAFDVNVGGTLNLIRCAAACQARQFIFASTEWVYGEVEAGAAQTEDSPIDAGRITSEYALTKVAGECLLAMAQRQGRLASVTILRFGIVYGPRETNWSAVEALYHAVSRGGEVEVKGSLETARRFIHVADVAEGIVASLGQCGLRVFNLSGDRLVRLREVVETSAALVGRNPVVRELDPAAVSIRNPDNGRARRELGWQPRYDLRRGLETLCGR